MLRHKLADSKGKFLGKENVTLHLILAPLYLLHKTEKPARRVFVFCSLAHWIQRIHNHPVQYENRTTPWWLKQLCKHYVYQAQTLTSFTIYTGHLPHLVQSQPTRCSYRRKLSFGSESVYSLAARLQSTAFHILNTMIIILAPSKGYGEGS